jgi:molybdopterin synthase catalytic subunit
MRFRVLCFGRLRELLAPELSVQLDAPAAVADLWQHLLQHYPALAPYDGALAIAVNQSFASAATPLAEGDEVALLPPVSGGLAESDLPLISAHTRLQCEPIDSATLLAELKNAADGAICVFDGIVRNQTRDRRTLYLEYHAYHAMAVAEMEKLALEALTRFAIRDLRLVHRVGRLEIGQTSVLIAVASAHRAPAFEACRWLIDSLKQSVPIWKKEFFEDGAIWADGDPFPPDHTV